MLISRMTHIYLKMKQGCTTWPKKKYIYIVNIWSNTAIVTFFFFFHMKMSLISTAETSRDKKQQTPILLTGNSYFLNRDAPIDRPVIGIGRFLA